MVALVALVARRVSLEPFPRFHLAGRWDADGATMVTAVRRVAARYGIEASIGRFPWWLVLLMAPFHKTMREVLEMRYLWRQELRLDNASLVAELGSEPHTPLDVAVE